MASKKTTKKPAAKSRSRSKTVKLADLKAAKAETVKGGSTNTATNKQTYLVVKMDDIMISSYDIGSK